MSLEQKIGQMILVYHSPYEFIAKYHIGGVLIMSNMLKEKHNLPEELDSIQLKLPVGLFVSIDQEGGLVNRLNNIPQWKHTLSALELSKLPLDSITNYASQMAQQLKSLNINVNLAPVVDPSHNYMGDITYMETKHRAFGRRAQDILPPASAFVAGMKKHGILCIAKHFPGYDANANSDFHITISDADSISIMGYMQSFKQLNGQVRGLMMSSIQFTSICREPSVLCPKIVSWARAMDSTKLIITDDLWGTALRGYITPGQEIHPVNYPDKHFIKLVESAFWAGNDILMITFPKKVALIQYTLKKAAAHDARAREMIDTSVKRILAVKAYLGLRPFNTFAQ